MFTALAISKFLSLLGISKSRQFYAYAKGQIGQKKSGVIAPIEFGCVEALNRVFLECFGKPIDSSVISTSILYKSLLADKRFVLVSAKDAQPGDIILSPTGSGHGSIPNGHVGVLSDSGRIISNNSANGIWDEHLTLQAWFDRFVNLGGYPVYYFRVIL